MGCGILVPLTRDGTQPLHWVGAELLATGRTGKSSQLDYFFQSEYTQLKITITQIKNREYQNPPRNFLVSPSLVITPSTKLFPNFVWFDFLNLIPCTSGSPSLHEL